MINKKPREIKARLLFIKSIVYRIFVVISNFLVIWLFTGNLKFSIGFTIVWNIINTLEYFGFDFLFSKYFKVGIEDE